MEDSLLSPPPAPLSHSLSLSLPVCVYTFFLIPLAPSISVTIFQDIIHRDVDKHTHTHTSYPPTLPLQKKKKEKKEKYLLPNLWDRASWFRKETLPKSSQKKKKINSIISFSPLHPAIPGNLDRISDSTEPRLTWIKISGLCKKITFIKIYFMMPPWLMAFFNLWFYFQKALGWLWYLQSLWVSYRFVCWSNPQPVPRFTLCVLIPIYTWSDLPNTLDPCWSSGDMCSPV